MRRLTLAALLIALGGFFLLASGMARPSSAASCTVVIGYSNTNQWFRDGGFESKPGIVNGEWENIAEGGSDIARLAYQDDWVWDIWAGDTISSRCTVNDRAPTTILFDVGFREDGSLGNGFAVLTDGVARARQELGFSGPIILKPMVGSSDVNCTNWSSRAAPRVRDVVAAVVASDPSLIMGPYLTIPCSQFRSGDSKGHFSDTGKVLVAQMVAAWWTGVSVPTATSTGPGATPANTQVATNTPSPTVTRTATPTATPPPAKSISACTVRTTYSDGTTYTRSVAVSVCQGLE